MTNFNLVDREELMDSLRNGMRIALKLADRLELQMVGIHLSSALECLHDVRQDKAEAERHGRCSPASTEITKPNPQSSAGRR